MLFSGRENVLSKKRTRGEPPQELRTVPNKTLCQYKAPRTKEEYKREFPEIGDTIKQPGKNHKSGRQLHWRGIHKKKREERKREQRSHTDEEEQLRGTEQERRARDERARERRREERKREEEVTVNKDIMKWKDKVRIIKELEEQEMEHKVYNCNIRKISQGRIYTPRKKDQALEKEIAKMVLDERKIEQANRIQVLTMEVKLAKERKEIVDCIIDTGSNLSFIHDTLIRGVELDTGSIPLVKSANDSSITILGSKELLIMVDNIVIKEKFYVSPNINSNMILGNSFLVRNKVKLNFKKREITLNLGEFKHNIKMKRKWVAHIETLRTMDNIKQAYEEIRLQEDIVIAPHQHRKIRIQIQERNHTEFEAENHIKEKKKCFPYLIDEGEGDIRYINIYNASNSTKYLNKDTLIGYMMEPEEIRECKKQKEGAIKIKSSDPILKEMLTDKDGIPLDISPDLTIQEHKDAVNLLRKYSHMFTTKTEDLGTAKLPPVKLETIKNAKPINLPPYKLNKLDRELMNQIIDQLIQANVLEECKSEYSEFASPVFLVKNRDNTSRLVADLRAVNKIVKQTVSVTPSVDLVLSCLGSAHTFTKLDVKNAFFQMEVAEESREILTIRTLDRLLRFRKLPMGLSSSTAIFGRALMSILNKYLYSIAIAYIDDVLVWGTSHKSDIENVGKILNKLDEFNLKLNTKKCKFFYKETNILGYHVTREGIRPQESNVKAILDYPRPTNVRKIRQFLGTSGFFRKHIKGYSQITAPLTELIKEGNKKLPFRWSDSCEQAFNRIKTILTTSPMLVHFKEDRECIVYCDASKVGLGGALLQIDPETKRAHPVAYLSKKYNATQARYSNCEREFLALTYTITYFRTYLLPQKNITVYTDCASLLHYKNFKDTTARLNRMALAISDFCINVKHIRGSLNSLVDGLSRNPIEEGIDEDLFEILLNLKAEGNQENIDFRDEQLKDPFLRQINMIIEDPENKIIDKQIRRKARKYTKIDGLIYYKYFKNKEVTHLLAIPESKVQDVIKAGHDALIGGGHFAYKKTLDKIRQRFFWETMSTDIHKYTQTCRECQERRTNTQKPYGLLKPQVPSTQVWTRVTMDCVGPLNPSKAQQYIILLTDSTSRMVFAVAARNIEAKTVATKLLGLFSQLGVPKIIQHDRGTHFINKVMSQLMLTLGVEQKASPPRAQWIQSTERFNTILYKMISHYVSEEPNRWSDLLNYVTFNYNTSVNRSTGYTPFYIFYGREAQLPILLHTEGIKDVDILKQIKDIKKIRESMPEVLAKAQDDQKRHHDKRHRGITFQPGDEVLISKPHDTRETYAKLRKKFQGPFPIKQQLNENTYLVEKLHHNKWTAVPIHVRNLKPFYTR